MNRVAIASIAAFAVLGAFVLGSFRSSAPEPNPSPTSYVPFGPHAGPTPAPRTLTTNGKATLQVVPDVVDVRVRLGADKQVSSRQATERVRDMKRRMLADLTQQGIGKDAIELSHVGLEPVYQHDYRSPSRIVGYTSSVDITIELRDFDAIAGVIDAAASAGAQQISTRFRSTRMPELKRQVREMALRAARDKAEQMASALDIRQMRVTSVSEVPGGGAWDWRANAVSNAVNTAGTPGLDSTEVSAGAQDLTLTVALAYEIL